jgi:hypothetical protein
MNAAFGPYFITAAASNTCGTFTKSVVSSFIEPENVEIYSSDTVLCSGTDRIYLDASDTIIGFWEGDHIFKNSGGFYFDPVSPGSYLLVFVRGFDLCRRTDSITVEVVPGNAVEAGEDLAVCNTELSVQLNNASPGGFFSGFGVTGDVVDISQLALDTTYSYTYTNPALPEACNRDARTVRVYGPPTAGFSVDRDTACRVKSSGLHPMPPPVWSIWLTGGWNQQSGDFATCLLRTGNLSGQLFGLYSESAQQ